MGPDLARGVVSGSLGHTGMREELAIDGTFATTHWSVVLSAREGGDASRDAALTRLFQTYWAPLYAYLRRQGHTSYDTEDWIQDFFEHVLVTDAFRRVDPEKGRFRTFLLVSLRNHVAKGIRTQQSQRRGGRAMRVSFEDADLRARCEAALTVNVPPEQVYDRVWAETVLRLAAVRLREEYRAGGRGDLYEAVRGWLGAEPRPGEYAEVGPRIGMTEGALAAAVFRLRRRYRELVRSEVAQTVPSPAELAGEMRHLLAVIAGNPTEAGVGL